MKVRTKTILMLVATLVIGMILGALASGLMMRSYLRSFGGPFSAERFKVIMERGVKPSPSQKEEVDPIIDKYSVILHDKFSEHIADVKLTVDSMFVELETVLTAEQVEMLKTKMDRMKRLHEGRAGRRGKDGKGPFRGRRDQDSMPESPPGPPPAPPPEEGF